MKFIFAVTMLWTIFGPQGGTILQYGSEQECRDAIEQGLPYTGVPPKEQLSCSLTPDQNPFERCSDGSVAYGGKRGEICLSCIEPHSGQHLTSVLCEGHGYLPDLDARANELGDPKHH